MLIYPNRMGTGIITKNVRKSPVMCSVAKSAQITDLLRAPKLVACQRCPKRIAINPLIEKPKYVYTIFKCIFSGLALAQICPYIYAFSCNQYIFSITVKVY